VTIAAAMTATTYKSIGSGPGKRNLPRDVRSQSSREPADAIGTKWSALHDAAGAVASPAGEEAPGITPEIRDFPAIMSAVQGWRRKLADQGISDLNAMMEPGLSALLAARAKGLHPHAAAQVLLQEFVSARDSILSLAPPSGIQAPD
jgi:hypothetical protein